MILTLLTVVSTVLAVIAVPAMGYLGFLALLARPKNSPPAPAETIKFAIVVPAHNEEGQIATTVQSLRALDYPQGCARVVVVADNCTDQTAARAAAAGADVMQRTHAELRGKGYALEYAFERLLAENQVDAIVVVDADTIVSKNLLQAFAGQIGAGARAVQAEYGVSNPNASWRTRLMTVALAMFHRLRSSARERLAVSAGLRGNGMCFTTALLREHPHKAYGLVEDVEYGIAVGLHGIRIAYADDAKVYGEMVSTAKGSETQRQRWEGGRMQMVREKLPALLKGAIQQKSGLLLDLALDLAVPPLSYLGLFLFLGLGLEAARVWMGGYPVLSTVLWGIGCVGLALYLVRGILLSELGFRAVTALAWAPVYVVWKVFIALKPGKKNQAWIRTRRESES